jgi:hypothetical protein
MRYFINLVVADVGSSDRGLPIFTTTVAPYVPAVSIDALMSAGRFEDAIELITPVVLNKSVSQIFTDSERDRILKIFKAGIDYERETYKRLTRALGSSSTVAGSAAVGGFKEAPDVSSRIVSVAILKRHCRSLIEILSNQLGVIDRRHPVGLQRARTTAIIGDMYRYISEVTHDDEKRSNQQQALSKYNDVLHVYYSVGLAPDDPERIRVQTNRELVLFSIPTLRHEAIKSLQMTIRELERELYSRPWLVISEEQRDFVQTLKARLELWNDQLKDEEWVVL